MQIPASTAVTFVIPYDAATARVRLLLDGAEFAAVDVPLGTPGEARIAHPGLGASTVTLTAIASNAGGDSEPSEPLVVEAKTPVPGKPGPISVVVTLTLG